MVLVSITSYSEEITEKLIYDTASYLTIDEQIAADNLLSKLYLQSGKNIRIKIILTEKKGPDIIGTIEKNYGKEKQKIIIIVRTEKEVDIFANNLPKEITKIIKECYYAGTINSNSYF